MENTFNIDNCLGFIANRLVKEFQRNFDEKLSPYGLTCAQFCVLIKLFEGDGLTQTELADRLYIENPTLVRTLDRLETSELLERRRDPKDRRVYHVYLLPKARDLRGVMEKSALEMSKKATDGLSIEEVDNVRRLLLYIWQNLAKKEELL